MVLIPGISELSIIVTVLLLFLWELFWKGIALWKAAHNEDRHWFVALLILNTLGVLPILYIYVFQKGKKGI